MTEATHTGAGDDLASAAKAIGGLMDAGKKQQSEEPTREARQESKPSEDRYQHPSDDSPIKKGNEQREDHSDEGSNEESYELPTHLEKLAESMGVDPSKLMGIKVKTKIDGQESDVSLADVIKSYQLEGHITKKSMALSEQQKAWEAQVAQYQQASVQEMQRLHAYSEFFENELFRDFKSVDWESLRQYNPAEYSAKYLEFQNRKAQIDTFSQQVNARFQEHAYKQQQEHSQKTNQYQSFVKNIIEEEGKALLDKIPEWKSPEKQDAGRKELISYLTNQGFDNDDISSVIDHRYILIARKAMLYDKMAQTKPETLQKAKQLPKFIKQSGTKSKSDVADERRSNNIKQLRKTGSTKDAAAAIFNLL